MAGKQTVSYVLATSEQRYERKESQTGCDEMRVIFTSQPVARVKTNREPEYSNSSEEAIKSDWSLGD